ncbi:MAG: 1-acyl-sn-glycerol-3-phosphate acyltransferase [Clostridia bacterium]|nr:1-acyl-sn-glycerol-3-phosphate acyltransferase [Clostridia bacterium]
MFLFFEFFRWLALITGWPAFGLFFKRKVYYEDKKLQGRRIRGGALIISNHYHVFDYMLNMFLLAPRKLYVVASELAFSNKWLRFGMKFFGGIEANRISRSMRFVDTAADYIKKGRIVQIYPEGKITLDGKMAPFKQSYLAIALRANAPIIPIIIDGNYGFFKRVHLIIGKPINLRDYCTSEKPSREEMAALNDMVYTKCLALKEDLDKRIKRGE